MKSEAHKQKPRTPVLSLVLRLPEMSTKQLAVAVASHSITFTSAVGEKCYIGHSIL